VFGGAIDVIVITAGGKGQRLGDVVAGTTAVKLVHQSDVATSQIFVSAAADYTPTFHEVLQLNDRDIELIQRALEVNRGLGNDQPVLAAAQRVKTLLNIQTDLPPVKFLYTVVKDFQHLTSR
jgi:hypothetical protein